ncbi:MAG: cupin domain-containing protein [Burkholderiales bacterium]|nr:cupin domain-containing protein [Burkholderiales bacterium]
MSITVIQPSRAEMQRCVARFSDLTRCSTGLPDMQLPECERTFLNVLGFSQPKGEGQYSPFGDMAPAAVSHLRAGFGLAFVAAKPGCGVLMHTHDTVETFVVMHGTWKLEWELDSGTEAVTLAPLDFIACPIGVQRRFECIEAGAGRAEGLLLGIIGGDAPAAEISPQGIARLVAAGIFQPGQQAA